MRVERKHLEKLEEKVKVYNFEVEGFHTYYVGQTGVLVHNKCFDDAGDVVNSGISDNSKNLTSIKRTGRGKNKISPDLNATGDHSVFKTDPVTGKITNYRTYKVNPKNPTEFDEVKGYDGAGKPHKNPVTLESLMPHVHDKTVPGKVREPYPWEIPE